MRHGLGLIRRDDLATPTLAGVSLRSDSIDLLTGTIMLSRTLLSTFRSLRRPGQSATRTHFTAAWQAKPSSGILQMFSPSHRLNATHRSGTSGGRSSFNAPRPPRFGFWQQISQRINRLPSDLIFWGIFGINGVVFVLWQIANTQWVSHGSLPWIPRQRG